MRFTTKLLATATALVACSCLPATLLAGPIQIQFTGLELEYDGFSVGDLNPFGSAALDTATIQHNGVNVTGSPMVSGVSIDLDIPNVPNIPLGGGSVTSAAGGTLDLLFPGGDYLSVLLGEVTINYDVLTSQAQFVFGASVGGVSGQSLPDNLVLDNPVQVSFSTNVDSFHDDGSHIFCFFSSGTGEINGTHSPLIPEPSSMLLSLIATAGCLATASKRIN